MRKYISFLAFLTFVGLLGYWYVSGGQHTVSRFLTGTTRHAAQDAWTTYANKPFGYKIGIPPHYTYEETGNPVGRIITLYPRNYAKAAGAPASIEIFVTAASYGEAVQAARQKIGADEKQETRSFTIPDGTSAIRFILTPKRSSDAPYTVERTLLAHGTNSYQITLNLKEAELAKQNVYEDVVANMMIELASGSPLPH